MRRGSYTQMELHRFFRALADPSRLRILNLLFEQPYCVCELEAILGLPQWLLSRHLAYLRNAGLAIDRRQGMRVQYSIAQDNGVLAALRPCLEEILRQQPIFHDDQMRAAALRGSCCPAGTGTEIQTASAEK